MKKMFASLMILIAMGVLPAMAAPTTLTGVITDDMCGSGKHMMPGKTEAVCTRECVKHGAKFAVVSNGKTYVLAGKATEVSALAGKKATLSGDLNGDTLTVNSVAAAK